MICFLCFLTGHFRNLFYFTILIFVHECGHFVTGKILGFQVKRIEIYPYGGCSKLEYDINVPLWKEFLVLVMGPITQTVFVFFVSYSKIAMESYFYYYHYFILIFNLLPIYPLDGGRLLHLFFAYFISYFQSLKSVFYFSIFFYSCFFFYVIFFQRNLIFLLMIILLGLKVYKEIKQADYYFQKFLMERYFNQYYFSKVKKIENIRQMQRDYYHYFIEYDSIISETEKLSSYFVL